MNSISTLLLFVKNAACAFLFFVLSTALPAQNWTPLAAGIVPNGLFIYSISAVGENVVWAVASTDAATIPLTYKIKVLRSSDGGQNWTFLEVEEAPGRICFQIVAVDSLTAWITTQDYGNGSGRSLFKTTDGGINWTEKLKHRAAGVNLNRFADGQHWLATNRIYTGTSSDDGETWGLDTLTSYFSNESQLLYSGTNMAAVVGDTVWHGTDKGRIVRFTGYGQTAEFLPGLGSNYQILSVAFQDHLNGLAWNLNMAGQSRIAKTTDGGATWAQLAQQPENVYWNIAAVPGSPGFYVLSTAGYVTNGRVAITKDFGQTWSSEFIGKALNAVQFTGPQTGWIGAGKISSASQPAIYKYVGDPLVGVLSQKKLGAEVNIGPNPTADWLDVEIKTDRAADFVLLLNDAQGHLLEQKTIGQTTIGHARFDLKNRPAGAYQLTVSSADGFLTKQVVKF